MENETLESIIIDKAFDKHAAALAGRCDKDGIDFAYQYKQNTLTVWMNFGNIPATVEINTDGDVTFIYFEGGSRQAEKFKNFKAADVETLLDHAFLFLRDGKLNHYQDWYSKLEKV